MQRICALREVFLRFEQSSYASIAFIPNVRWTQRTTRLSYNGLSSFTNRSCLQSKNFRERLKGHVYSVMDFRSRKALIVYAGIQSYRKSVNSVALWSVYALHRLMQALAWSIGRFLALRSAIRIFVLSWTIASPYPRLAYTFAYSSKMSLFLGMFKCPQPWQWFRSGCMLHKHTGGAWKGPQERTICMPARSKRASSKFVVVTPAWDDANGTLTEYLVSRGLQESLPCSISNEWVRNWMMWEEMKSSPLPHPNALRSHWHSTCQAHP